MSDTPRTDAVIPRNLLSIPLEISDIARTLERELAKETARANLAERAREEQFRLYCEETRKHNDTAATLARISLEREALAKDTDFAGRRIEELEQANEQFRADLEKTADFALAAYRATSGQPTGPSDSEMLDWLEKQSERIGKISFGPSIYGERWILTNTANYFGLTLRGAIRAAMSATLPAPKAANAEGGQAK